MADPPTVSVTTQNTLSLTMGIIALVLGVLALLVGWVPFLGLIAIPVALVGLLLAFIGVVVALGKRFKGIGMPFVGGAISAVAVVVPIVSTGGTSAVVSEAATETARAMEEQRAERQRVADAAAEEEAQYIRDNLELYEVDARYRESVLHGRVPDVLFKIRNNGDRELSRVSVTVYFKDASGTVIAEEDFHPVLVSSFSIGDDKPLKPGYVWQMEAGKFYTARSVPSEWQEGAVDAEITEIEFSE